MARRAAGRGTRRPRKPSRSSAATAPPAVEGGGGGAEDARPPAPAKGSGGGFFCCYLLRSLCPRLKGRTYIGFTVNPRRRIRQHNGEIGSGAWRTRSGRPWEMVLCIHGFPTNVAALQFEWAWQHPTESLAVRKAASGFKSLSGAGNKIKLAYAMLNLPSWESMNLTVNFFASTSTKFAAGCPPLPSQMKTVVCAMEDLQCNAEANRDDQGPSPEEEGINDDPQGHQGSPRSPPGDEHSDSSGKQPSSDQMQQMDAQTKIAVYDVEENDESSDEFAPMEWDGIHDLTVLDRSRASPQCPLSSDGNDGRVVDDELGQASPVWRVRADSDGGDGGVVDDELMGQTSPMLKVCADSDCGDSGVSNDELGPVSPLMMVHAGSDNGGQLFHERDVVVDLVTPTPVCRLRRRDGVSSICSRIIDLTTSPAVIEL